MFRSSLYSTGALALGLLACPAVAQTSTDNQGTLEDIVVTASRRAENQQNVPIAISTVSGNMLGKMGVPTTESLGVAIPSVQFGRTTTGGIPFLRGVGTAQAATGVESPVALYVDDVYYASAAGTLQRLLAVDSLAVLKGPQGTLFGRNASAGVIQVQTKNPSHDPEFSVTASYGNFDTAFGSFYATTGLSDTVAVNIAVDGEHQGDGWGRSIATGEDIWKGWDYNGRVKLLWEPSDTTSLVLSADYTKRESDIALNYVPVPGVVALGGATYPGNFRSYAFPRDLLQMEGYGGSAKFQHDFGGAKLVSISAYRRIDQTLRADVDGSLPGQPSFVYFDSDTRNETFSQELQLLSPDDRAFTWIMGAYYFYQDSRINGLRNSGLAFAAFGGFYDVRAKQELNSYSGFGEATYHISPSLKFTGGLRYTSDHFDYRGQRTNAAGILTPPGVVVSGDTFSKLTYRAILSYEPNKDMLLYASYSRGFKSGGYTLGQPSRNVNGVAVPNIPVLPEVLDTYEVGVKSELFGRILRLNASAFYYDYANIQVTSVINGLIVSGNAAAAKLYGLDVDATFAPTARLSFTFGASVLHSEFKEFPNGPLNVPNPAVCTPVPQTTGPLTGGNTSCSADLSGNRTARAPKFSGSISATYVQPTSIGDFTIDATFYHNSGFFWEVDNRLRQNAYDLVNGSISWENEGQDLQIKAHVKNLFNKFYQSNALEATTFDAFSPGQPRTYGVSVTKRF